MTYTFYNRNYMRVYGGAYSITICSGIPNKDLSAIEVMKEDDSKINYIFRDNRSSLWLPRKQPGHPNEGNETASLVPDAKENLPDEGLITGNTLLSISPLRASVVTRFLIFCLLSITKISVDYFQLLADGIL
ncbi:hypothetical protein LOAG_03723 [Loa loa]|uniref:Uncharacterized protein n=1 Tax=Loa loa TaxID=7209 RepID=A0A1S0U3R6_LOALO|nr:hypothetical protein LOAG_03723 [Loa loa]EFO24762.1 hypothetical protein LOAG_03723 [Loa loa]